MYPILIMLQLTTAMLKLANSLPVATDTVNGLTSDSVMIAETHPADSFVTQFQTINPASESGITVPTSSVPLPALEVIQAPAAYSVFDAPNY